ncbi:hypothetical protein N7495_009445 [Penicillium taxi]|uniref:uncharacterized protein n=1 Tax=Penicillium taxi TaxID=168475 RepID=UPI002544E1D7|nr:uncharacterized protein N7495_009445 [Penicillium taxi]KAJ5884935.1 hypothetical protein N7495_009445 [Penicillium taxi]
MQIVAITTVFTCLSIVIVALRLWTRVFLVKTPGKDDILIGLALISSILFYAFVLCENKYGLGIAETDLPKKTIETQLFYLWLSAPFYNLSLALTKLSATFLYTRIFRSSSFMIAAYFLMGYLIITGIWMIATAFVFCLPISVFWSKEIPMSEKHHYCLPLGAMWYSDSALQMFSDVFILILPMPLLSKLHLPRREKAGVILMFALGIFVFVTGSVRLYEIWLRVSGTDPTKENAAAALWSSLETNVSIICACLPPLHPLLSRILSFCFRPQPIHSSPPSTGQTTTTPLTTMHKPSIYSRAMNKSPDGGVFFNNFFFAGPASYSASITKVNPKDDESNIHEGNGIRVVRELRMFSDAKPIALNELQKNDLESGGSVSSSTNDTSRRLSSIEWDLEDFEFPDYKERMNASIF